MDEDVLAEFECVCAESRRILRMGCTDCDLCFYYSHLDVNKLAESNPWSFFEEYLQPDQVDDDAESEGTELLDIYQGLNLPAPVPLRPNPAESSSQKVSLPVVPDTFDDSLILPTEADEDLDASIARRKAAINEKLFRIGIVPGWSDPIGTYGPYELNRRESVKQPSAAKRTLSMIRPRKRSVARPISGISMDLYDQLADLPDDTESLPATPELESPSSLKRISTDVSEESFSEDELEFPGPKYDPVIRRISGPEQLDEFAELFPEPLKPRRASYYGEVTGTVAAAFQDFDMGHTKRLMKRSRPTIHL